MLTAKNFRKQRVRLRLTILIILIIVLIITIIFVCIIIKNKKGIYFKKRTFYILYIDKNEKQSELYSLQDTIKKLGGGGEIYFDGKFYYLTASVYHNKTDASSVLNNIFLNFSNSGILTLERNELSSKVVSKINENSQAKRFFKFFDECILDLMEIQYKYMAGIVTQRDLISNLISKKLELEEIMSNFNFDSEDMEFNNIYQIQSVCLLYFNNFLNKFFESSKKESLLCELCLNIVLSNYELFKNIN